MPRIYLFDLMDTLVEDPFYTALPEALGLSAREIVAFHRPGNWVRFELGEIDEETYRRELFRPEAGEPPYTWESFLRPLIEGHRFLPGMEELLRSMSGQGARMAIASNYPPWIENVRKNLDLDRFFAEYYVSYRLRVRKPDPLFYREVLERENLRAEDAVFIDDRTKNVDAAREVGMEAILFEGAGSLAARLAT